MHRTVASELRDQRARSASLRILVWSHADGNAVAALLANGVDKVVERLFEERVCIDFCKVVLARYVAVVEIDVVLDFRTAVLVVEIVDGRAVKETTLGVVRAQTAFAT